jgi:hypothetical protein
MHPETVARPSMIDSRENRTAILSSAAKETCMQGASTQNAGESGNPKSY